MPFADELLAAALPAVYLIDAVQWLQRGECAIEWRGERPARFGFGPRWTLAGRRPWLPLPFVSSVAWRVRWRLADEGADRRDGVFAERAKAAAPVARLSTVNAVTVALVAPLLLLAGEDRAFVWAVVASVALTLASATLAYARRAALGCTAAQIAGTAAIAIVCLPCGGNFARALVGRAHGTLAVPDWITSHLQGESRQRALASVREELEQERGYADEDSPQRRSLDAALARVAQEIA
jgi:hypothetical protein